MPDQSTRNLSIWLPSSIQNPSGSNILQLAIVDDEKIQGGRRAITRNFRPSNVNDPARIRRVEWEIWGPIGNSLESTSGVLGIDFAQNLETRWARRLLAGPAQTYVTLSGDDPPGIGAYYGQYAYGSLYYGSGTGGSSGNGPDVVVFGEQQGLLYAYRGKLSTQIDIGAFTVLSTVTLPAFVYDADHWRSHLRVAIGPTSPMQTLTSASSGVQNYDDTVSTTPSGNVYAYAVKRGSDRAWYIDASSNESNMGYTLDAFVNLANPFQVGDPDVRSIGIGPFGPLTMIGAIDNLYSFTDQGKPVPLSRALYSHHSSMNGKQWADPGWGWNYAITAIGLRAIAPGIDNPVGPGESMRLFTGHAGVPIAVHAERGEVWVVYQTPQGAYYGYRGAFSSQTAATGQPAWFPWFYETEAASNALFSSTTDPTFSEMFWMIRSRGSDMAVMLFDDAGRDDINPNYQYSQSGGTAYLTTLDRDTNLLKTLRLIRGRARNVFSGASFSIEMGFDTNPIAPTTSTYTTIGSVTSDGFFTVVPNTGGTDSQGNPTPTASISGRTIKPRITLEENSLWETLLLSLTPGAYWPLGEDSGDANDDSGNGNDGTVTDGAGTRATTPLNFNGDGSITYGAGTDINVPHAASINNIWDGTVATPGGTLMWMSRASSGTIASKGWEVSINSPINPNGSGNFDVRLVVPFSVTNLIFDFTNAIPDAHTVLCVLSYDSSSVSNTPSLTVYDLTEGDYASHGSVYTQSAVGTRTSDSAINLHLGSGTSTLVGILDETALFKHQLSETEITSLIPLVTGTSSPELDGTLEVMYDERPDMIEEVEVAINMTGTNYDNNFIWDTLNRLVSEQTNGPFQIQLPDDQPPAVTSASGGGSKYAMIAGITARQDIADNAIEAVSVTLHVWPRSGTLEA